MALAMLDREDDVPHELAAILEQDGFELLLTAKASRVAQTRVLDARLDQGLRQPHVAARPAAHFMDLGPRRSGATGMSRSERQLRRTD